MKFIVSTKALLKNLQLIEGVIGTTNVLPITECFLFALDKGTLNILATDLETTISLDMEIEGKEGGKVAIPAKILLETLKTLADQPLTFKIDPKTFAVEITSENGKYRLAGHDAVEFPGGPELTDTGQLDLPMESFQRALKYTLFAAGTDDLRPSMTGMLFEMGRDGVTFVATDAHKLVKYHLENPSADKNASFIVPKKPLGLLKGMQVDAGSISISQNGANAFFSFGHVKMSCRLIEGKYPDYNAVIPKDNPNVLMIPREELQNALKRTVLYANRTTHQLVFKITGNDLVISSQDIDYSNEANERLPCNYQGADMEIAFNGRFLIEMLAVLETDEVRLDLSGPTRPGVLFPTEMEEGEDFLMLVMPVMLGA